MEAPEKIIYEFDEQLEKAFDDTIELLKDKSFRYSRYTPLLYLKDGVDELKKQQQRNMRAFMKDLLVKRLESSFYAFRMTLGRFIESYKKFITKYEDGVVYVGDDNVWNLLENDDVEKIEKYIDKGRLQEYKASDLDKRLIVDLQSDFAVLEKIHGLWNGIKQDPKLDAFVAALKSNTVLKKQKLIIFTEAKETADYLYDKLRTYYPQEVFAISGAGGLFRGESHGFNVAKDMIEENYKPLKDKEKQKDEIRLLITTDVLSEGVNLHRSNTLINYDLPWNPTRVLQRVGRVNRVGTEHAKIYIFNFFPTEKSNNNLHLEENIIAKINAFHSALGEDAKYLSDDEQLEQHGLAERLYRQLNAAPTEDGEEEISALGYLKLLRDIRDNDKALFRHIKDLPKKIRATQKVPSDHSTGLVTFFRKGTLKKFVYATKNLTPEELTLNGAIEKFECPKTEKGQKLPETYYDLLAVNKKYLQEITQEDDTEATKGRSNTKQIVSMLDGVKKAEDYTDTDREMIITAAKNIAAGYLSKFKAKKMWDTLKDARNPQQVLGVVRDFQKDWIDTVSMVVTEGKNEVILSKCFHGGE